MVDTVMESLQEVIGKLEVDKTAVVPLSNLKDTPVPDSAQRVLPNAQTLVLLVMEILPEIVRLLSPRVQTGQMNLRALFNRDLAVVNNRIDWEAYKLVKALHRLGYHGVPLPAEGAPFDTRFLRGLMSYHRIAEIAGIGVIGWHSLLMTPEFGPRIRLACVISDIPVAELSLAKLENSYCVECGGTCIKACPASAIKEPNENEQFRVDKFACSSYLGAAGGCSECMKVCPVGNRVPSEQNA